MICNNVVKRLHRGTEGVNVGFSCTTLDACGVSYVFEVQGFRRHRTGVAEERSRRRSHDPQHQ